MIGVGIGLGVGEFLGGAAGPRPKLDLKFAATLSLTSSSGITPSFSRASSGPYFDSSGVLRYAALNKVLYSEEFNNAYWDKSGAVTVTSNQVIAPDGKLTADLLKPVASNTTHYMYRASLSYSAGSNTLSLFVKYQNHRWIVMQYYDGGPQSKEASFDILNGATGLVSSGASSSISNVGDGWYRISITSTNASSSAGSYYTIALNQSDSASIQSWSATGTESVAIWGAQLEASSTVGTYVPTTSAANSAPRFDHAFNGTSWVSRGLLVEEQRTNSCLQSQDLTTTWTTNRGSITANATVAPDGTTTADRFVENTATGVHGPVQFAITTTNGSANTVSGFFKAGTRSVIVIRFQDNATGLNGVGAEFNLSNGTISVAALVVGTFTSPSATITNVGGGWYRCAVTGVATTTSCSLRVETCTTTGVLSVGNFSGSSYAGDGSSYFDSWGYQMEAGSFPTSYIPTTSASSTRSADVCQITGGDFTSFWNASEGAVAVEFDRLSPIGSSVTPGYVYPRTFQFAGTSGNSIDYFGRHDTSPAKELITGTSSSVQQFALEPTTTNNTSLGIQKIALGFASNDAALSYQGASVLTDNTVVVPVVTSLAIGSLAGSSNYLNGHIARLRYFNKRLTDKQLEDLCKPEEQLKLDLKFSENLSLTPVVGPTPSFSRASTGTYFNASGVLTSAAINAPRFDHTYDGTNWISRGLLIEEQRTNLLPRSEEFNAGWTNNDINISANSVTAPDGTTTADNLVPNTTNTNHRLYQGPAGSGVASVSVFAKSTGYSWLQVRVGAGGGTSVTVNFDIVNGSIGDTVLVGGATASGQSIESVGNGWWRCKFTTSSIPAFTTVIMPRPNNASVEGQAYAGDGVKGVAVWGAQLENASFPTSYIPTTSSSVVRSADVCQITGTDFSGFWNQGEGSFAAEWDARRNSGGQFTVYWVRNSADNNSVVHTGREALSPPGVRFSVVSGGSVSAEIINAGFPEVGALTKTAGSYRLNDFAYAYNGALVGTDTSGAVPVNPIEFRIGYDPYGSWLNGHISRLRYYSIRLPNRLLIAKSQ